MSDYGFLAAIATKPRVLTIGSLFSGIGGLELGLERGIGNGSHTIWQVEQDEYCRAVLAKHWPNAKRYEDVRNVGRETLEAVDIICGGFPCQDISSAGKRAGIRGARSGLWSEYARIVRELRPRFVVVENVSALLSDGIGTVLGDLAESGYDAEWDCIPASSVGAPHRRDRVFIVANANGGRFRKIVQHLRRRKQDATGRGAGTVADSDTGRREWPRAAQGPPNAGTDRRHDAGRGRAELADAPHDGLVRRDGELRLDAKDSRGRDHLGHRAPGHDGGEWWEAEPGMGRVADGVPSRVDRLRALGNAVVPQVAEVVGRLIAEREKELRDVA